MQHAVSTRGAARALSLAALLACALLGACSKPATPQRPEAEAEPTSPLLSEALGIPPDDAAPTAADSTGDKSVPASAYWKLDSGVMLMNLYHALSALPPDIPAIATQVSADYRNTTDQFRRKDLLAALEPRLRADIADAARHRHVVWEVSGAPIEHYVVAEHRFPIRQDIWNGNGRFFWNDNSSYQISFLGDEPLHGLTVSDEATARTIEDRVSRFQPLRLRIYAFAQGDDPNQKVVKARMLRIELVDDKDKVLAVQAP